MYACVSQLSLISRSPETPYGSASFRHSLRMRPFLGISIPPVPTYEAFAKYIEPLSTTRLTEPHVKGEEFKGLHNLVDSAERSIKFARRDWEAVSKSPAETARCHSCEETWRGTQKNVLRSVIAGGIALVSLRKWIIDNANLRVQKQKLEFGLGGHVYHKWWIVPEIKIVPR